MKLSELLLVELHDDELSEQGGVSYSGERLIDFLLEAELLHLIDEENGFFTENDSDEFSNCQGSYDFVEGENIRSIEFTFDCEICY